MKKLTILLLLIMLTGCLTTQQEAQYVEMKAAGFEVQEKSPELAAGLGVLPGIGGFYVGRIGWGVFDLLLWPYSIIWDPFIGYHGARDRNYKATLANIRAKKRKDLQDLDDLRLADKVTMEEYEKRKILINKKYRFGEE